MKKKMGITEPVKKNGFCFYENEADFGTD